MARQPAKRKKRRLLAWLRAVPVYTAALGSAYFSLLGVATSIHSQWPTVASIYRDLFLRTYDLYGTASPHRDVDFDNPAEIRDAHGIEFSRFTPVGKLGYGGADWGSVTETEQNSRSEGSPRQYAGYGTGVYSSGLAYGVYDFTDSAITDVDTLMPSDRHSDLNSPRRYAAKAPDGWWTPAPKRGVADGWYNAGYDYGYLSGASSDAGYLGGTSQS